MTRSGPCGDYDDESFTDDDFVYRRVPDNPDFLTQRDPITGERRPQPVAFSIRGQPDGLSITLDALLRLLGLGTHQLCNWDTHGIARFRAKHVRPSLGVIANEDTNDLTLGKAHGLVRGPNGCPSKIEWNPVRDKILEQLEYFESDPGGSADRAPRFNGIRALAGGAWSFGWAVLKWVERQVF